MAAATLEQLAQQLEQLDKLVAQLVSRRTGIVVSPGARSPSRASSCSVVQPTPFCNIDCKYCYLPDRASEVRSWRTKLLINLFTQVSLHQAGPRNGLSVVWHAGEPMVLPIDFYRDAFAMIARLKPRGMPVTPFVSDQWNSLVNEAWCRFFLAEQVNLGVSIDGPRRLHDRNRVWDLAPGHGTFDRTIAGIRLLRRTGVPFHVISVLSTESSGHRRPRTVRFLRRRGNRGMGLCFNVEESEGSHVSEPFAEADVEAAYSRFLSKFWRLSHGRRRQTQFHPRDRACDPPCAPAGGLYRFP